MHTREEREIIICMNPDELRALADKMERVYPTRVLNDSCFVDYLHHSRELKISLYLDQEWFMRRDKAEKDKKARGIESRLESDLTYTGYRCDGG